jgi:hypothetical protein
MITIFLVFLFFLLWNIWNETLFLKYNGIKSKVFQYNWHLYDALLRVVVFTTLVIRENGFNIDSVKYIVALLLLYHILFDIGFNIKRAKDIKKSLSLPVIFYVGSTSKLDIIISKINSFLNVFLIKLNKTAQPLHITNIVFKSVELIITIILCFG